MKRKFLLILLCAAAICTVGALTACTEKHEHNWNDGEVTTPATCAANGVKTYTCIDCGQTRTEAIAKTEHPHSDDWLYNDDEHWQPASCEHTTERLNVSAHVWDAGEVITEATCLKTGLIKYTCVCGKTRTDTVKKADHVFSTAWSSDGVNHWHVCTTEGCDEKSDEHSHNWNDGEVTTPATCSVTGVKTYTCNDCGKTKTETVGKAEHPHSDEWLHNEEEHWQTATCEHTTERVNLGEHNWGVGQVITEATCLKTGLRKYTCVCGLTRTEIIEKTDHIFETEWSTDGENHWHSCATEGCTEIKDHNEHIWNDGEITTPATCISEGVKTFTCTVCNKTKTQSIDMTEHVGGSKWKADENGHYHVCTTEGCSEKLDCEEHTYGEWERGGQLARFCAVCNYEDDAPKLSLGCAAAISVGGGQTAGVTLFATSVGYYTVKCTAAVEIEFTCCYFDILGELHENKYTVTSEKNTFTIKLEDRSVAYITAVSSSQDKADCTLSVSRSDSAPEHTHNFADEWSADETWHWHACTGEGCEESKDSAEHELNDDGVCTVCGYGNKE